VPSALKIDAKQV